MKKLLIFLLLASSAAARDITLIWDANPPSEKVTSYIIMKKLPDGKWEKIGETSKTELTIPNFPDQETIVAAYAVNDSGISPPSDELTVGVTPSIPKGMKVRVVVTIEASN